MVTKECPPRCSVTPVQASPPERCSVKFTASEAGIFCPLRPELPQVRCLTSPEEAPVGSAGTDRHTAHSRRTPDSLPFDPRQIRIA